jgi:hypothetical protein
MTVSQFHQYYRRSGEFGVDICIMALVDLLQVNIKVHFQSRSLKMFSRLLLLHFLQLLALNISLKSYAILIVTTTNAFYLDLLLSCLPLQLAKYAFDL